MVTEDCETYYPIRSQCTLSLSPENIRKPYGFQGVERGCIGKNWVKILFESKIMPISQHLIVNSKRSQLLQYVNEREQESVIRVSQKLIIYIYVFICG